MNLATSRVRKIEMMRMTYAHAYVIYSVFFHKKLQEAMTPELRTA